MPLEQLFGRDLSSFFFWQRMSPQSLVEFLLDKLFEHFLGGEISLQIFFS